MNVELSDFYMMDEVQGTYRGMMIAIPAEHWMGFSKMSITEQVNYLKELSAKVNLKRWLKQPRKKKNPQPKRIKDPKQTHVSTAKLLSQD